MKKRIDVIASQEAYTNLSTFTEIEELNITVRSYRDAICATIKRKDVQARLIKLLEVLKRHSCKQIGVSYMCKNSIASYINVSYKTIQRLMKKLEDLGLIKQVATKRKSNMMQTANAIIINPFVKEEVSDKTPTEMTEKCPTIKTSTNSLKQNIKNKRNIAEKVDNPVDKNIVVDYFDYSYVSSNIPKPFVNAVKPFFNSASEIYRLWGRLCLAAKKTKVTFSVEDHIDVFIKTFKETIFKIKQGHNKKDMVGYIYGAWRNNMSVLSRQLGQELYNFLEVE